MSFAFQSHDPIMQEGNLVGYRVTPYISVHVDPNITVHVQSGQFWGGGGVPIAIEDVPSEVWDSIDKWSEEARKSVGLDKVKRPTGKKAAA